MPFAFFTIPGWSLVVDLMCLGMCAVHATSVGAIQRGQCTKKGMVLWLLEGLARDKGNHKCRQYQWLVYRM